MDQELKHPFLNGLTELPKGKEEIVDHLRLWMGSQPHLPHISDDFLLLFLHSCYDSLETSKTTIENYFTARTAAPELFDGRNPLSPRIQLCFSISNLVVLPDPTPEGHRLLLYHVTDPDPSRFHCVSAIKTFLTFNDIVMSETGLGPGYVLVLDMDNVSLSHFTRVNLAAIRKLLHYVQECHPVRLKAVHIINTAGYIDKLLAIIKPLIKKQMWQLLHFHGPVEELAEFLPLDILPQEFGGKAGKIQVLHDEFRTLMESDRYVTWLQAEQKLRTDETKRMGPLSHRYRNVLEGSFRKLDID